MSGRLDLELYTGDCRQILPTLPTASVQCIVTSPPYLRQRRYGDSPLEIGLEPTLKLYVATIADVFDELRRILDPSGLAWLNIGDKANGSGGAGGDWSTTSSRYRNSGEKWGAKKGPGKFRDPAFPEACYLDVPGAVVAELIARGWRLRLPIVWHKLRPAPEDPRHVRRPSWSHEMIYLLAPGSRRAKTRFYPSLLAERGSVWTFPPGGSGPAHLAPFPDELARRCILPSTLPGDVVLDPFGGGGTTARVAREHGRRAVSIELYET